MAPRPHTIQEKDAIREVGEAFRNWRENQHYTMRDLAEELEIGSQDVSRLENAQTPRPSFKNICLIARFLGHEPNEIAEM